VTTDLQTFRYDQLLRRVGGIIGPGSKVKEVIPELFPMLDVERVPIELLWLSGWRVAWGGVTSAAIAAEFPKVELFNPVGSGKMFSVTDFNVSAPVLTVLTWTTTNVSFPVTVSPEKLRDTRRGAFEKPTGQIRTLSSAGQTVATNVTRLISNVPFHFRDDNGIAVLFPGTGLELGGNVAADSISANFVWRERIIEPSELTGV